MRLLCTIFVWGAALGAECIRVEGEFIRVSDLPQIAGTGLGGEEILLRAPAAGVRRTVESTELRRLLRLPDTAPPLSPVCFEQVTESLTPERIIEAMQAVLAGRAASIRVSDHSRYPVPKGRLEFPRSGLFATSASNPSQAVLWRGRIVNDSKRTTPVWARVVIDAKREVLTSSRTLDPGMRIESTDLVLASKAAFPFDESKPLQPADAIGRTVRRRIPAGGELTQQVLAEPYDIEARQTVTLEVRADAVRLKMPAIAEGHGRTGDSIWLKQTTTGKRVRARITGPRYAILEINLTSGEKADNEGDKVYPGLDSIPDRPQP